MDDDIDIEEHDVLDNPAIKNIFPDLSILKKEITLFDGQDLSIKPDPDVILINSHNSSGEDCENNSDCSNVEDVGLEDYVEVSEDAQSVVPQAATEEKPIFQNKIILGSRPAQTSRSDGSHYELHVKPYLAKVLLNDIRSYLENNQKFCKICQILFSHKLHLETHIKNYHDLKDIRFIKNSRYTCEKCFHNFSCSTNLYKHLRNIHNQKIKFKNRRPNRNLKHKSFTRQSIISKRKHTSKSRCFHCQKLFPSQKNLIEHIYKVLQSSNLNEQTQLKLIENKNKIKEAYMTRRRNIRNLLGKSDNAPNEKAAKVDKKSVDVTTKFYKCYYCSTYFRTKTTFISHLVNKHNDKDVIFADKVRYDPYCKFCSVKQGSFHMYNSHLHYRHPEMIHKTFKIQLKLSLTKVEYILAGKQNQTIPSRQISNENQINIQRKSSSDDNRIQKRKLNDDHKSSSGTNKYKGEKELQQKYKKPVKSPTPRKKLKIRESIINDDEQSNDLMDIVQTEDLVLKGILFKCKRCDIHFLTSRCAMNHSEHMEMLINWKCRICLKIFKKQDESLHNQQHAHSNEFVVYELSESKLARVLYKCSKCAIHFSDDKYAYHFKICGKTLTESTYCNACDILLEKSARTSHDYEHEINNHTLVDFTIVTSDVISSTTSRKIVIKKEMKTSMHKKLQPLVNKTKSKVDTLMWYCKTCKSFISHSFLRSVHKEGRCHHMIKHVCKYCGLILTNQAIKSHRKRHKEKETLRLQDFKFYDMKSNKRILPPIPEYPKCYSCDVHFLTKNAVSNHLCNEIEFLTCPICNIKLSDEVFKLHLSFHHYSLKHSKKRILGSPFINESDIKSKIKSKHVKKTENDGENSNGFDEHSEQSVNDEQCKEDTVNKQIDNNGIISQAISTSGAPCTATEIPKANLKMLENKLNNSSFDDITDLELDRIVYCCAYCYITLLNFDQVVEHCHDHYSDVDIDKKIITCTECRMKYDKNCINHNKIHDFQKAEKLFKILKFDAIYFAVDYKLWIQNLFSTLEQPVTQSILNRSIYRYEGRIKLKVIQKGVVDVMIYKCKVCRMFVDPEGILSHTENSCFRLRKHICSFCGIPFISHVFRMSHEEVHQNKPNLTITSFKIVIFNRDHDKEYNKNIISSRNTFILFQCRTCKGLFERFQCRLHICNKLDLKECSICSFLICNSSYKSHMMKHALISNYSHSNMRIIRFGKDDNPKSVFSGLPSNFTGVVNDYTFHKCLRCNLYIKKSKSVTTKHDCLDRKSKLTCSKCNLSFLRKQINNHYKMHDNDPYFKKENFNILLLKETDTECLNTSNDVQSKVSEKIMLEEDVRLIKVDTERILNPIKENASVIENPSPSIIRIAKIYKCDCSLSFLDVVSINLHLGHCNSKISKQTCTKCSLVFTPKDLFTHLLKHHGDKKHSYKFNIIRMNKVKNKIIKLYNCTICNLHFVEGEIAKNHFDDCLNSVSLGDKCGKCKLFFEKTCFELHKNHHHNDNVADFDIIDLKEESNDSDGNTSLKNKLEDVISQVDAVIDVKYDISKEILSQISLNNYSNTIYKCVDCNIHFLTENTFERHLRKDGHGVFSSTQKDCEQCGLNFTLQSLTKHVYVHHYQMKLELSEINIKIALGNNNE